MKAVLKIEELAEFIFGIVLFNLTSFAWWWFPALILLPDLSMLGYLINNRVGAITYNFFHHKALGIFIFLLGWILLEKDWIALTGIILFAHSAMDRFFGYGLKYEKGFKFTHLGEL